LPTAPPTSSFPPRGVVADDREDAGAHRGRDVELPRARRRMHGRVAHVTACLAEVVGDHSHLTDGSVTAKLKLKCLAVFGAGREQHRAHQCAPQGGTRRRRGSMSRRRFGDERGGDERSHTESAVGGHGAHQVTRGDRRLDG